MDVDCKYALTISEIVHLMHSSYAEGAVAAIIAEHENDESFLAIGEGDESEEVIKNWILEAAGRVAKEFQGRIVQAND